MKLCYLYSLYKCLGYYQLEQINKIFRDEKTFKACIFPHI